MPPRCPACPTNGSHEFAMKVKLIPTVVAKKPHIGNEYGMSIKLTGCVGLKQVIMAANPNRLPEAPTAPALAFPDFLARVSHKRLDIPAASAEPHQPTINPVVPKHDAIIGPKLKRQKQFTLRCRGLKCMKE